MFVLRTHIFAFCIAMFALSTLSAYAQNDMSAHGTEFWITFPPNEHQLANLSFETPDSLLLKFVYDPAEATTPESEVTVSIRDRLGSVSTYTQTVPIGQVSTMSIPWINIELIGDQNDLVDDSFQLESQLGTIALQHVLVESTEPIILYAANQAIASSDASLITPKRHLGRNHVIVSYSSTSHPLWVDTLSLDDIQDTRTPSQIAVVATEDSTEVAFDLSARDAFFGSDSIVVVLNKGESYLVQADYATSADFTGSMVRSTKPIAVFSSHQRAFVPHEIIQDVYDFILEEQNKPSSPWRATLTRDYLFEQAISLRNLGTNFVFGTYVQPPQINVFDPSIDTDKVRITTVYDNTEISINGVSLGVFGPAEVIERNLSQGMEVTSTQPIAVATLKKSSTNVYIGQNNGDNYGDPFLVNVSDVQQWDSTFLVYNIESAPMFATNVEEEYQFQYIQVVGTLSALNDLTIDGRTLNSLGGFSLSIDNSPYFYANVLVQSGQHRLQSSQPFGATVYGYGRINSYGYMAGSSFRRITPEPEDISFSLDSACNGVYSSISGPLTTLVGIDTIELESGSQNVNLAFEIDKLQDTALAQIEIVDVFEDGIANYKAVDSDGLSFRDTVIIPGFTLRLTQNLSPEFLEVALQTSVDRTWCFEYRLENYGLFRQDISELSFLADPEFDVVYPDVSVLAPGESILVTICFVSSTPGEFAAELKVEGPCAIRDLVQFSIETGIDDLEPQFTEIRDSCGVVSQILVTETHDYASGLQTVNIEDLYNTEVLVVSESPDEMRFTVEVQDPYEDAWFTLRAIDSAGLSHVFTDTIPGLTLAVREYADWQFREFEPSPVNPFLCDTITIENYGLFDYTIEASHFENNIHFSTPPKDLPVLIPAGGQAKLVVCVKHPRSLPNIQDQFVFARGCTTRDLIVTSALPNDDLRGDSRCNVVLTGEFVYGGDALQVSPVYPNPASSEFAFDVQSSTSDNIEVLVTDYHGRIVFRESVAIERGSSSVVAQLDSVLPGAYSLTVQQGSTIHTSSFVVLP